MNSFICCLTDCTDETEPIPDQGLCGNVEAVKLLVGLSVPKGDKEGNTCQQGVWAEGEARHKRATGSPGLLGTSSALHSLKAANIKASWKEGVTRSPGQGVREHPPDLRPTCVRKHRGSSPERIFNKSNGNCSVFTCSGFQGCILLGFESKIAGFNLSRSAGVRLA